MTRFSHVVSPKLASTTATGFVVLTVQGRPFVALKPHLLEPDLWGILWLASRRLVWSVFFGEVSHGSASIFLSGAAQGPRGFGVRDHGVCGHGSAGPARADVMGV